MLVGVASLPPSFSPSRTWAFYIIRRQNCLNICNRVYKRYNNNNCLARNFNGQSLSQTTTDQKLKDISGKTTSSWMWICSFRNYFILLWYTILCSGTQTLGDVNCWQNCLNLPFLLDTRWALVARQYGKYKVNINFSDDFHRLFWWKSTKLFKHIDLKTG